MPLVYTNRQSFPFRAFHWWRTYYETMHYSPVNNDKKSLAPLHGHATFRLPKTADVF